MLIVPEQSHFETERMVYRTLGPKAFGSTDILSFTKLGARITAASRKAYAADTVREITMLKAVRELRGELAFYGSSADKPDFASRMLGAVENFQREGVSPGELLEAAEKIGSRRLCAKTRDMAAIYERYTASLNESFADRADEIRTAAGIALRGNYFEGKRIYIDGFDGFTGAQFSLIEAMIKDAEALTITLASDREHSADPRYIIITKLIERLKAAADRRGVEIKIVGAFPRSVRTPANGTEVYALSDVYEESGFTAAKIRELITSGGYRQNQIAVLNPPSRRALSSAFAAYGLSEFSDVPEAIIEKPVVRFIITLLEFADGRQGAVLDLIKSGFLRQPQDGGKTRRLSRESIRLLTRTAHEWQLGEADWEKPFPLGKAERIRAEITAGLFAFRRRLTEAATGGRITEVLADFLLHEMEIPRTIADIIYVGDKVDSALNDEYRQLWETVISIFESMHGALREQEITLGDYAAVLARVFAKTRLAKPPQVMDAVLVGDLRRTRASGVKVVFIMGANQGEFPGNTFAGEEFTESETEELCRAGVFISENRSERYHRERFIINRAMTLPTERLYITAPLRDEALREKKLSRFITDELKAAAGIKTARDLPVWFWASHKQALKFLAAEKPQDGAFNAALFEALPDEHRRLSGHKKRNYLHRIDVRAAEALVRRESLSPSRIETLNTCLFKYFCAEGLRIGTERIRNAPEPDALTRGNLTHYVLERALTDMEGFLKADPCDFEGTAREYITEFERREFHGGWARSARRREILQAHAAGIAEVLKQIREDMEASDFRPLEFEKQFGFMLGDVLIKGKIDRIDEYNKQIRVIDYKTGSKQFSLPEVRYGLNMQALLYLFAVAGADSGYKPSGAFYRLVNGGRLSSKSKAYGAAEDAANPRDLYKNRMETQGTTGLQFGSAADVTEINAKFRQTVGGRTDFIKLDTLDEAQFARLAEEAATQLGERLGALYGGDVRAVPIYGGDSPCGYCDYRDLCGNAGKFEEIRIDEKVER
jgi:ATP-dependent helicase/nuclease subunit B